MPDPLSVIFVPGAVAASAVLVSPLLILLHRIRRRRARALNAERRCGRCGNALAFEDLYVFGGQYICPGCASTLRRRLSYVLPVTFVVAAVFAVSSGSALVTSTLHGGPSLAWWLDGRWIPLLLPSVGLAGATVTLVALGRRANQLRNESGPDIPDVIGRHNFRLPPGA